MQSLYGSHAVPLQFPESLPLYGIYPQLGRCRISCLPSKHETSDQCCLIVNRSGVHFKNQYVSSLSTRGDAVLCGSHEPPRQVSHFKSGVWRAVLSDSYHHPQEVLLVQSSLYTCTNNCWFNVGPPSATLAQH